MFQAVIILALAATLISWAAVRVGGPQTSEEQEYEDNLQKAYLASLSKTNKGSNIYGKAESSKHFP